MKKVKEQDKTDGIKIIDLDSFAALLEALKRRGFEIIGPKVNDNAIIYDTIHAVEDLPRGWTDEQEAGRYRLKKRSDSALFGYNVGPHAWKKFLHPAKVRLWEAKRNQGDFEVHAENYESPKRAFLGVRACELAAIDIQDKVFMQGAYVDPIYKTYRENIFVIAINCTQAGGTCFCVSMKTGPRAKAGFDLALTEVVEGNKHYFIAQAGNLRGEEILKEISARDAAKPEVTKSEELVKKAARKMGRAIDTNGIKELLYKNSEHPHWEDVANRCLSCANCTMACPTCFCTTVEDVTDLTGDHAERWRKWDSCFQVDFSYIHGGYIRPSVKSRYRQWMTHKLASWIDQFGVSGCVGCGRCITWCPVGIDITQEVRAFRGKGIKPTAKRLKKDSLLRRRRNKE